MYGSLDSITSNHAFKKNIKSAIAVENPGIGILFQAETGALLIRSRATRRQKKNSLNNMVSIF